MVPINTENVIKELTKKGFIKDLSISVFSKNKFIKEFEKIGETSSFYIFSAGKPLIAAIIWKLVEKEIINFNDPICKFWPEFGKKNKDNITIKHVLTHSSGVSLTSSLSDRDYTDLNRVSRWIENYIPESEPGERIAYHEVTYGWILGELIYRVTNKTFEENFKDLVGDPLGLSSISFNSRTQKYPKKIIRHNSSKLTTIPTIFNIFYANQIPLISGTCISNSYDLAKFYNELINNNKWLKRKFKKNILRSHIEGNDYNSELKFTKLGLGVRLNSKIINISSNDNSETFGHSGLVSCVGLGSFEQNISIAILNNLLLSDELNEYRMTQLISAIILDLNKMKL